MEKGEPYEDLKGVLVRGMGTVIDDRNEVFELGAGVRLNDGARLAWDCFENQGAMLQETLEHVQAILHDFGVPGIAIADFPVGGVVHVTTGIAGLNAVDSLNFIINSFQTPETTPRQCCSLKIGVHITTPSLKTFYTP